MFLYCTLNTINLFNGIVSRVVHMLKQIQTRFGLYEVRSQITKRHLERRLSKAKRCKTLRFVKSEEGWYLIERDVPKNLTPKALYEVLSENCFAYVDLSRPCDTSVEGDLYDMKDIANAIRTKTNCSRYRCAVSIIEDKVAFYSPRNSEKWNHEFSYEEALKIATQIELELIALGCPLIL